MDLKYQLPHVVNSIPSDVITYQTSFYVVALEGWRRGLKLKFYNSQRGRNVPSRAITYSLSDGENEYHFICARGTKSQKDAIDKAENKSSAYEYLKANNVPVPETKTFIYSEISIEEMCGYGESIGYPLVVKPANMGGGKGVITDIKNRIELENALLKVRNDYNVKKIIIEKYFEGGYDYRFYVMGDEVLAVSINYPSNVIGNGKYDIQELIEERNIEIKDNIATKDRSIKIDTEMKSFLESKSLSLNSVPEKNERVFLRQHGKHLGTRLNVACTDNIDPKFKQYAVDALHSVPGLPTGSIDMIINEDKNEGIVNEINTKGEIMMHVIPFEGKAVDIPKQLIDYYFPESQKINNNFYFEYKPVKELFLNGHADEITIPKHPEGEHYECSFKIEGQRLGPVYIRKLKRKAASLYLKGHIESLSKKQINSHLIGSQKNLKLFEEFIYESETKRSKINKIETTNLREFEGVVSIELEVSHNFNSNINKPDKKLPIKKDDVTIDIEKLKKEINEKEKTIDDVSKELKKIYDSKSWKITKPLRKFKRK